MSHRIQSFIRDLKVPGDLQPRVTPAMVKLILYTLGSRADFNTLECYPSKERIAKESGAHLSTVKRVLNLLEEVGIIVRWRRKTDTGSWAESHYRLVLDVKLPAGWSIGPEKSEEKHGGFSENPRKKTKQSGPELTVITPAPSEPEQVPSEPGWVPSEPLTTKEPPLQPPTHIQTASPKQSGVCDSSKLNLTPPSTTTTDATGKIFEMWPVDSRKIKEAQLQPLIQKWEQDNNRSALDLVQAAKVYLKVNTSTPAKITWLRAWIEREEWRPHLPKGAAKEKIETAEQKAEWDAKLDRFMETGQQWPRRPGAKALSTMDNVAMAPTAALHRALWRAPSWEGAGYVMQIIAQENRNSPKDRDLREFWETLEYRFQKLERTGDWSTDHHVPDPRVHPQEYPAWLVAAYVPNAKGSAAA